MRFSTRIDANLSVRMLTIGKWLEDQIIYKVQAHRKYTADENR